MNDAIDKIINGLNAKSKENHKIARIYFFVLVSIIVAGLAIFIFAYTFTSSKTVSDAIDDSKTYLISELRKATNEFDSVFRADTTKFRHTFYTVANLYDAEHTTMEGTLRAIQLATVNANANGYDDTLKYHEPVLVDAVSGMSEIFNSYRRERYPDVVYFENRATPKLNYDTIAAPYFDKAKNDVLVALRTSNYELFNLINTSVIRFGSVVIVLFLVQILVRVFRYNTRIANFYSARADALELYKAKPDLRLESLIASLSPDILDIGISKSPTEQLVELTKLVTKP